MTKQEDRTHLLWDDRDAVYEAMADAVARAIEEHRLLKQPIVIRRGDEIVEIPPDEIPPYTPPKRRASA